MARTRRSKPSATRTAAASASRGGEFTCPECGKTFSRAAALGAHRRRAHGVVGTTSKKRGAASRGTTSRTARGTRSAARSRPTGADGAGRVDRDALLQTLFPNGVPAREAVIRAANGWLDQAEQLARMK